MLQAFHTRFTSNNLIEYSFFLRPDLRDLPHGLKVERLISEIHRNCFEVYRVKILWV